MRSSAGEIALQLGSIMMQLLMVRTAPGELTNQSKYSVFSALQRVRWGRRRSGSDEVTKVVSV